LRCRSRNRAAAYLGEYGTKMSRGGTKRPWVLGVFTVTLSLCTTAHPLYTRFTNRSGFSIFEATVRPRPATDLYPPELRAARRHREAEVQPQPVVARPAVRPHDAARREPRDLDVAPARAGKRLGWSKRCEFARAFPWETRWEYSFKKRAGVGPTSGAAWRAGVLLTSAAAPSAGWAGPRSPRSRPAWRGTAPRRRRRPRAGCAGLRTDEGGLPFVDAIRCPL
jgi:hypothetical protein